MSASDRFATIPENEAVVAECPAPAGYATAGFVDEASRGGCDASAPIHRRR